MHFQAFREPKTQSFGNHGATYGIYWVYYKPLVLSYWEVGTYLMKKIKKRKESNVVKNIWHRKYIDVLFNKKMIRHKMKRIQSKLQRIGTYNVS